MKLDALDIALRDKRKGDSLVENGMYVNAIRVYQKLLEKENLEQVREGLTRSIFHNLGCAYSYLFQMEKALECFQKAYSLGGKREDLVCYLLALKNVRTPIEYESKTAELGVDEDTLNLVREELDKFAKRPEKPVYSQHVDEFLDEFTREYHRSTGA